jgi:hypothetical protein
LGNIGGNASRPCQPGADGGFFVFIGVSRE